MLKDLLKRKSYVISPPPKMLPFIFNNFVYFWTFWVFTVVCSFIQLWQAEAAL